MAGGYIEINDTDSIIRGTMAGVDGTFSGTFSSNNIDAISSVNVRDGAVSSYYHFHFDKSISDFSFTLLKQPFTSIVDIVVPILIAEEGGYLFSTTQGLEPTSITVYKNGELFSREYMHFDRPPTNEYVVSYISALRIVDFNVNSNTTYRIVVNNIYYVDESHTKVDLQGQISVGFRKR